MHGEKFLRMTDGWKGIGDGSWKLVHDYEDKHLFFRITCTDGILHNNTSKMYWDSKIGFRVDFKPVYACMFVFLLHLQCIFYTVMLHLNLSKSSCVFLCFAGECKYDFQAWGECDSTRGMKTRTGVLKRALMDANCPNTVSATKPCGKPKTKIQGTRPHT